MNKSFAILALCAIAGVASAAGNFSQDPLTGDDAWGDIGVFNFQDDLTITDTAYSISNIRTFEVYGDADFYTLNIYNDLVDNGGTVLYSFTSTNVSANQDLQNIYGVGYNVDFDTSGLTLGPGTYYVNFSATSSLGFDYYWFNANVGSPNGMEAYLNTVGPSSTFASGESFDFAWNMNATPVPEPATMAVLGLGALAALRRKRAK